MSWAPAGQTATAVVTLGPQQQQTLKHRQRQQQPRQRELLERQHQVQLPQLTTSPHQQLGTQPLEGEDLHRASVQIHETAGQRHRRQPKGSGRNVKNASGGEAISSAYPTPLRKWCNPCTTVAGEAAGKRGTQPGSAIVASQMFKTKLCIDHQTRGCTRGSSCPYAHSVEEMRNLPDLRKTKMCSLVLAGKGCKNRACKFAHSEEELRYTCTFSEFKTRICRFAQERGGRGCLYGIRCPYAHSPSELRPIDNSAILPTDNDHPEESRKGVDTSDEVLLASQHIPRNDPNPSLQQDIKGKHGLWRQQREMQVEHSTALRQQDSVQQPQKERIKQQPQVQIWQKSQQQQLSPQALGNQNSHICQRQQQDLNQQRKQPRMQPQSFYKQQHLRNLQSTVAPPTRNSGGPSQQSHEADTKEKRVREGLEKSSMPGMTISGRSAPHNDNSPYVQQKIPSSLLEGAKIRQEIGSSTLAKLPRSLNKGTRALSTMADTDNAEIKDLNEGRPQEKINLKSAEGLWHEQDARESEHSPVKPEKSQILQFQKAGSLDQGSALIRHFQQPSWKVEVREKDVGVAPPATLVQGRPTCISVGETSSHYVSASRSPGTSMPQRTMASLTVAPLVRSTVEDTYDPGSAYGDSGIDAANDAQVQCLRCSSATSETRSPVIDTNTPLNEGDQGWSFRNICKTGYNGPAAVLPPPGFEHVRVKPLSDVAYAGVAPWIHTTATTKLSNREECLLFHLHKQLLLHCQRKANAEVLPKTNMRPLPPSSANEPEASKARPEISYLGVSANDVWKDAFLSAPRNLNL